jgi:hypothetical protein
MKGNYSIPSEIKKISNYLQTKCTKFRLERGPQSVDVQTGKTRKEVETSVNITVYL